MEKLPISAGLKRAATSDEKLASPKAGRMSLDDTSPNFMSPIHKSPELKFNSAEMPPPKAPTPRRALGSIPQGIRKGSPKTQTRGSPTTKEVQFTFMDTTSESKGLGADVFADWFKKTDFKGKIGHSDSPKSSRVTKLARRSSSTRFSTSSSATALHTISEESAALTNAIPHDLGVPKQLISLFSAPIKCSSSDILTPGKENDLRAGVRAFSLESPKKKQAFKRPLPLGDLNVVVQSKKTKSNDSEMGQRPILRPSTLKVGLNLTEDLSLPPAIADPSAEDMKKKLLRSQSESAVSIMQAVEKSEQDPLLIGDCSRRFSLPLVDDGKLSDLKLISGDTLTALIDGVYFDTVDFFDIIDCRYPYEFHGGHIKGAFNLHTQKQTFEKYLQHRSPKPIGSPLSTTRSILIFHCEFSSQRGPAMCRFVRGADRQCNQDTFPSLHYPEMYVLQGGYKSFYENHREYCEPCLYTPMCDPGHAEELKLYRNKSKTELHKANSSSQMKGLRIVSLKKLVL